VIVLISASTPAPPLESDPAIDITVGNFSLQARVRYGGGVLILTVEFVIMEGQNAVLGKPNVQRPRRMITIGKAYCFGNCIFIHCLNTGIISCQIALL
jgi:hypothetical protein